MSTSRQRVRDALAHRQPDRTPVDLGGTFITGVHCSIVAKLREHYGLEPRLVKIHEPYQMLGSVEPDLLDALGVDVQGVFPPKTIFGFPVDGWKEWTTPWGQRVLVPGDFNTRREGNDVYIFPKGDTTAPPSGHMPAGGYFFDTIVRQPPIDDDSLDPADNLEEFGPLSDADLGVVQRQLDALDLTGDTRARIFALPGTGLGDIALVPAPFLTHPKGIRDIEEWYTSTLTRQHYVKAVFEKQVEIAVQNMQRIHDRFGDAFDAVVVCGTDFGTQSSQFCSNHTFREVWLPYYKILNDWIHRHTGWKTFKHSCGAVWPFIDSFIEAGFDILNPVQCSATGMDPHELKRCFGGRITFWGGGVDTQHVLPFGTPEQVRAQVLDRLEIFSPGGGFVFNTIHNAQARTPIENMIAMIDAIHEFNGTTDRLKGTQPIPFGTTTAS